MNAGELNQRVSIEARSVARDAATGAEVVTWTTLATRWAQVQESVDAGGVMAENTQGQVVSAAQPVSIRMRWLPGVQPTMRVRLLADNRIAQIVGAARTGKHREQLQLACAAWAHE